MFYLFIYFNYYFYFFIRVFWNFLLPGKFEMSCLEWRLTWNRRNFLHAEQNVWVFISFWRTAALSDNGNFMPDQYIKDKRNTSQSYSEPLLRSVCHSSVRSTVSSDGAEQALLKKATRGRKACFNPNQKETFPHDVLLKEVRYPEKNGKKK